MLKIYCKLGEMNFSKLMEVYAEGNADNAAEFYSDDDPSVGMMNAEQDFYQYLKEVFFNSKDAVYAIWEENAVYISALRLEPYQDGLLLEALETHPDYRRKGYARKLLCAVLAYLKSSNYKVIYSHIHKQNFPSIKTHLSCGFARIAEHAVYIDGSVNSHSCTMSYLLGLPDV